MVAGMTDKAYVLKKFWIDSCPDISNIFLRCQIFVLSAYLSKATFLQDFYLFISGILEFRIARPWSAVSIVSFLVCVVIYLLIFLDGTTCVRACHTS